MTTLKDGQIIRERYTIRRVIGKGGMATVYLVEDSRLPEKRWAMKEMGEHLPENNESQALTQFRREAEMLARLSHPYLPKVVDFFTLEGRNYLVMEYLQGKTLDLVINENQGFIEEEKIRKWGMEICEVLEYLHSQEPPIIFRDIKPDNIIVDPDEHIRLIDFGIARMFDPGKREDTIVIGTPGFASPEQYGRGQTDFRSDIYSLGATMYCLATGMNPAEKPFSFLIPSSVNPNISPGLDSIILKCLEIDPARRFSTAAELKNAFRGNPTSRLPFEISPSVSSVDLEVVPPELIFALSSRRTPAEQTLLIRNRGRKPLRATLSANRPWITVKPEFFEENEKQIAVKVDVKEESRRKEHQGRILLTSGQGLVPIPVKVRVLPSLWELEMPHLVISILFFCESLAPLLGTPGIIVTYLMLDRKERDRQKIPFAASLFFSIITLVWFLH